MSQFQFSLRRRPEFQRLLELLREQSVLQPALREELRDFFQARLDDLRQARDGEVPEILDYRRWFEYVLQVQSRTDGASRELSRQRLRFGSTGEQAVPTYLLVLAVATSELDGVTPALAASSTLFVEKTAEQDVFVSDYHWERPGVQAGLLEPVMQPKEADLVLGVARAVDPTVQPGIGASDTRAGRGDGE